LSELKITERAWLVVAHKNVQWNMELTHLLAIKREFFTTKIRF